MTPTQVLHQSVADSLTYNSEILKKASPLLPLFEEFHTTFSDISKNCSYDFSSYSSSISLLVGAIKSMREVATLLRWFAARGFTQESKPCENLSYGQMRYSLKMENRPLFITLRVTFPVSDSASDSACTIVKVGTKSHLIEEPVYKLVCPETPTPSDTQSDSGGGLTELTSMEPTNGEETSD